MNNRVIYEVLRIIDGKPIFLEDHLIRMKNSFKLINEDFELKDEEICAKIKKLINLENKKCGNIKITYDLQKENLDLFFIQHFYPSKDMYRNGVKTILYFGERENPNAKILNEEFRKNVNEKIKNNDAYEAILVNKNGYITEGSKSNIFMVKGNDIITSPVKSVLPGVTRGKIINLANKIGINVIESQYDYKDIEKLDSMFISGTSPKVLPIKTVNETIMNINNDIMKKIMEAYDCEVENYIKDKCWI